MTKKTLVAQIVYDEEAGEALIKLESWFANQPNDVIKMDCLLDAINELESLYAAALKTAWVTKDAPTLGTLLKQVRKNAEMA